MSVPANMLAARLLRHGGPEVLELQKVPTPLLESGEVLVEVRAAALNNTDVWTREGAYGLPGDPDAQAGWRGPIDFPRVQGADVAGVVVQTAADVDAALRGARVLVDPAIYDSGRQDAHPIGLVGSERDGGYAQYVAVPARSVYRVEGSPLTDTELACLPTAYGTALGMLERAGVAGGDTVLVTGASGGVGLALVQLATARDARVIAVSSAGKLSSVRDSGADEIVDRADDIWDQVNAVAPGGVDVVLDVVAGGEVARGMVSVRDGGRWVVAGALGGYEISLDIRRMYLHNIALIGSSMHTPAHFESLVETARQGQVRPVVAATYELSEVHQAQADLAERRHVGKLVLVSDNHAGVDVIACSRPQVPR